MMENSKKRDLIVHALKLVNPDLEIQNIPDKDSYLEGSRFMVYLNKDGIKKYFYYDTDLLRETSNIVDGLFQYCERGFNLEDYTFLLSYQINGKQRVFLGINNLYTGVNYPIGYDFNKEEYFTFPRDKFGLIDDKKMIDKLKEEKEAIGFDARKYQEAFVNHIFLNDIFDKLPFEKDLSYGEREDLQDSILSKLGEHNKAFTSIIREAVHLRTDSLIAKYKNGKKR